MQNTLDLSIKKHEIGTIDGAFIIGENMKSYQSYMNNSAWNDFVDTMKKDFHFAYDEYNKGSGGELTPKGHFPPKMASYGSSSRMIYNLCKDIPNFHFEYQLPTKVGGIANLDGFIKKDNRYVFIEAKCREPYGIKSHLIDNKYKTLYEYINNDKSCNLNIHTEGAGSKMDVTFYVDNNTITCFDIKQMICHLLGIAVKFLSNPTKEKISFLYLCYNPKLIEIINKKKKEKIYFTYDQMCEECNAIDFHKLFEIILRFLSQELNIGQATENEISDMISNFDFSLCDQSNYMNYLN